MTTQHPRLGALAFTLLAACGLGACGDSLEPAAVVDPTPDGQVRFTHESATTTHALVDATSTERWVLVDLDRGEEVDIATAAGAADWDLAVRRSEIKVNGGVSGAGGVEVAETAVAFAEVERAPEIGWVTDRADSPDDDDEAPDYAFAAGGAWYDYDASAHLLSPRDTVYALRSTAGDHFAIELTGYYDAVGTSGFVGFRFAPVAGPSGVAPGAIAVDASSAEAWTYLRLEPVSVLEVSAPETSDVWDLAFKRTEIRTNGGTSGGGLGGARLADAAASFDSISASPTTGFVDDAMLAIPGPPGSGESSANAALGAWYDYDPATHAVSPKEAVFLVRGAAGGYAKLAIDGFGDGVYALRVASLDRELTPQTLTVDASDPERWVTVSLRAAAVVTLEDPGADPRWDLALRRTAVRTNSGTSGPGAGGAVSAGVTSFGDLGETSDLAFAADAMAPLPGPPGSGESSANPAMSGWYAYDPATHAVSPKPELFLVRTADGGVAAVSVAAWEDGVYTLEVLYAGAGRTAF